jgi:PilZ domain
MNANSKQPTGTADRRAARRLDSSARIRLRVAPSEIDGRAENISETGILFLTAEALRVSVEVEENGIAQWREGRLIRSQVMGPGKIGWAVEFDSP